MALLDHTMMSRINNTAHRRKLLFWGLYFVFWTLVGLAFADYVHRYWADQGEQIPWTRSLLSSLPDFYVWAALSPLVFWITRRVPIQGGRWARGLLAHIPATIGLYALSLLLIITFDYFFVWGPLKSPFWTVYRIHLRSGIWNGMLVAWGIVAMSHAMEYTRRYRQRELEASRLETELARAQLQVLRMQLQPHFLFNTLHAVSTLMHRDVDAAERMLIRLADLLRLTLEHGHIQEVTLKRELEFLDHYLHIERVRFGKRLTVEINIPEHLLGVLVPNLILQPLVENAIKHGISPKSEDSVIEIRATREGDSLALEIRDNGTGLPPAYRTRKREGVGLTNTRKRLAQLYGDAHTFDLANRDDGGLRVSMRFPLRKHDQGTVSSEGSSEGSSEVQA